jgi:hypothetical protein
MRLRSYVVGASNRQRTCARPRPVHETNRGYGENQKSRYRLALDQGADTVVLLHPDYQYEPKAVPLLIASILAGRSRHDVRLPVRRHG